MGEKMAGSEMFADLTCGEVDILRAHLGSGGAKQFCLYGYSEGGLGRETHEVISVLAEARRLRWNAEHPDHTY